MQALNTIEDFYAAIAPNEGFTHGYTLTNVKEFKMSGGIAWTGTIKRDGRRIGYVECEGNGGCYSYTFNNNQERFVFDNTVKQAYEGREMLDVERDCFINWLDKDNLR